MLRATYSFFCDICGEHDGTQQLNIPTGGVFPNVAQGHVVMNNVALCKTCAELAAPAMNEALKERLKHG